MLLFFFKFYAAGRVLFFLKKIFCLYFLCMHCECEAHFLQYLSLMSVHIIQESYSTCFFAQSASIFQSILINQRIASFVFTFFMSQADTYLYVVSYLTYLMFVRYTYFLIFLRPFSFFLVSKSFSQLFAPFTMINGSNCKMNSFRSCWKNSIIAMIMKTTYSFLKDS